MNILRAQIIGGAVEGDVHAFALLQIHRPGELHWHLANTPSASKSTNRSSRT